VALLIVAGRTTGEHLFLNNFIKLVKFIPKFVSLMTVPDAWISDKYCSITFTYKYSLIYDIGACRAITISTTARYANIPDPFLGNGLENTFPEQ
jgi:hypothetical protein